MMNEILTCIKVRSSQTVSMKRTFPSEIVSSRLTRSHSSLQLIKTYAWEIPFRQRIYDIREKERAALRLAAFMQSITVSLVPVLPTLASVATFLVQAFTEKELAPEQVGLRTEAEKLT
jgi:hypothetical protein